MSNQLKSFLDDAGRSDSKEATTFFGESIDQAIYDRLKTYGAVRPNQFSIFRWTFFLSSLANDLGTVQNRLREAHDLRAAWLRRELDYSLFVKSLPLVREIEDASFNEKVAQALADGNTAASSAFMQSADALGKGFRELSVGVANAQTLVRGDQERIKSKSKGMTDLVEIYQNTLQSRFTEDGGALNFHERYLRQRDAILALAPSVYLRAWSLKDAARLLMNRQVKDLPEVTANPGYFDRLEIWLREVMTQLVEDRINSPISRIGWMFNYDDITAGGIKLDHTWLIPPISSGKGLVRNARILLTPWGEQAKHSYVKLGVRILPPKQVDPFNPVENNFAQLPSLIDVVEVALSIERGTVVIDLSDGLQNILMGGDEATRKWVLKFEPAEIVNPSKFGLRVSFELEYARV